MVNVAELVASGKGIGELRTLGVTPAEIRAAGFTIEQMFVHLGVRRLKEANFTLTDFQNANFPLSEICYHFPLFELLHSNTVYPLKELIKYFPPSQLRREGHFSAADFLALGNISVSDLTQFEFTEEEIQAALVTSSNPGSSPTDRQPPHAAEMNIGDSWKMSWSNNLQVEYSRLSPNEAKSLLSSATEHSQIPSAGGYGYDGSGKSCPRCGRLFVLTSFLASADDMHADEEGVWICDDPQCGMRKYERYRGYGSIFA